MKTSIIHRTTPKLLKLLGCGLLLLATGDLHAQLIKKIKFTALEGYTNGWMIGQPSAGGKWENANADWEWVYANEPAPESYSPLNNGKSWTPPDQTEPWYIVTATNTTAAGGGQMMIASDGNRGTNAATYFWKIEFPKQLKGPITVTWDWQFRCTNDIPADYDPKTNTYSSVLPGFDHGFGLADYANRAADGDYGNPNWKYNELSSGVRLSSRQDCRYNGVGSCGGGGSWYDKGPEFKDGKVLHMKTIYYVANGYVTNGVEDLYYANTYDNFVQRDGEEVWQNAKHDGDSEWKDPHGGEETFYMPEFGMRRCVGEVDPTSGINCVMCWMNGDQFSRYVLVSNIRVTGPDPVPAPTLRIDPVAGNKVKLTFTGWLQAADSASGPFTDVALPESSPLTIPAEAAAKFYRAEN
jgi:hypothetical protein